MLLRKSGASGKYTVELIEGKEKLADSNSKCETYKTGVNAVKAIMWIKPAKSGNISLKYHIRGEGVDIYIKVYIAIDIRPRSLGEILDTDVESENAEDKCENNDLMVIVACGDKKKTERYQNLSQKEGITIHAGDVLRGENSIHIFVYFEHMRC